MKVAGALFDLRGECPVAFINPELCARHYLGPTSRGVAWVDEYGCAVWASPTSRRLPSDWLELSRWCLRGTKNGGSRQFAQMRRWLLGRFPYCTTLVSYSDPEHGHTGSLYRACNWLWAPTWHRIVTPPTGNGSWLKGERQGPKDRWVFPLRKDKERVSLLRIDQGYTRRFPWAEYREPSGANYKQMLSIARSAKPQTTRRDEWV